VVLGGAELQGRRLFLSNCLRHIRHRAWVGALRLRGRSLGSRGMPLEGFLETVLRPLGSRFGASWGLFWASWGLLGLLGASWGLLGASWRPLGAEGSDFRFVFPFLGLSWGRLWALLGRLGGLLGRLGALLGRLGALLGRLGPSWGGLGGLLGRLGASGRRKSENAKIVQKCKENQ